MWWELEEEGYRVTITPNTEDNTQQQERGERGGNLKIQHWALKELIVLDAQAPSV